VAYSIARLEFRISSAPTALVQNSPTPGEGISTVFAVDPLLMMINDGLAIILTCAQQTFWQNRTLEILLC
jgi:hypothetical protein